MRTPLHFDWQRQASAEQLCLGILADFRTETPEIGTLEGLIREGASGRLLDWLDHLTVSDTPGVREKLAGCGFRPLEDCPKVWAHPGAILPRFVFGAPSEAGIALRVESVENFLQIHSVRAPVEGSAFSPYRQAVLHRGKQRVLVVERRGTSIPSPSDAADGHTENYLACVEMWRTRPRSGDPESDMAEALRRGEAMATRLGPDLAAHIVCEGERNYWLSRNSAGRAQKTRQDALGLGWGNHDHHTFRSSRRNFHRLVELFAHLGFHLRERFYAGEEAGWGAQLMENPAAGLTLFLDVDLAPEEVETNFAREELPQRGELGTVGLWCALHGDSILQAGMHHLAAQFDFRRLIRDLAPLGFGFMSPFSDFPYLKQAFSMAERWAVDPKMISDLVRDGSLRSEQGDKFLTQGAIGSHLENIERGEGYKGFNKKNVSLIIRETDPRQSAN